MVPVHPELARVLSEWRSHGFAAVYGRKPSQVTKAPDHDCAAVGIEDKGTHGFRRYFITYARADVAMFAVLTIAVDLDQPQEGILRIDQGPMVRVAASLKDLPDAF